MRIQEYISEALQDLLEARTYISTNSIVVARKSDRLTNRGDVHVEIECEMEERLSENHDLYNLEVSIQSVVKIQEDGDSIAFDALAADVSDFTTQDLNVSALNAAITAIDASSGITADGVTNVSGDRQTLDQYEYREQRLLIHFNFTN